MRGRIGCDMGKYLTPDDVLGGVAYKNIYIEKNLNSLSEVHFNTGRLLFEFNGLQYSFATRPVFVAFANPASVPFG